MDAPQKGRAGRLRRYAAYIFDLYGTLVDIRTDEDCPALWREMAGFYRLSGASYEPGEFRDAYQALERELEGRMREACGADVSGFVPEIDLGKVFAGLFEARGVAADSSLVERAAARFRRASTRHIRVYAGAFELLGALRQAGSKVCLLTNAQRLFTEPEIRSLGLFPCFDEIVISSDYGHKKPDAALFRVMMGRLGLGAGECLMIGNDPECDVGGALSVGMDGYYVHSALSPQPAPPISGEGALFCAGRQEGMDLREMRRRLLGRG